MGLDLFSLMAETAKPPTVHLFDASDDDVKTLGHHLCDRCGEGFNIVVHVDGFGNESATGGITFNDRAICDGCEFPEVAEAVANDDTDVLFAMGYFDPAPIAQPNVWPMDRPEVLGLSENVSLQDNLIENRENL